MFSSLRAHSIMDRQRRRRRRQQLPEVYKLISPPFSEGMVMALKPALVSGIALACCAPLPLPFFLLVVLFRSQESVALQLHSQVGHWSLPSGHLCRMNNNLRKMKLPQSGLSKRGRELQEGFSCGTGCAGQQEVLL